MKMMDWLGVGTSMVGTFVLVQNNVPLKIELSWSHINIFDQTYFMIKPPPFFNYYMFLKGEYTFT